MKHTKTIALISLSGCILFLVIVCNLCPVEVFAIDNKMMIVLPSSPTLHKTQFSGRHIK